MEKTTSKTIEDNQIERSQIKEKLNGALRSYRSGQENFEKLIKQLDSQSLSSSFDQQTATAGQKLVKSANDQLLNRYEQEAVNLLNEREELKSKLASLEQCVEQYVQKEAAYKETLIKADKIVFEMESQYKNRIEQLESNEKLLSERIVELEKQRQQAKLANSNLRNGLAPTLALNKENVFNLIHQTTPTKTSTAAVSGLSSPSSQRRQSELVEELLRCQQRECQLVEQINKLNANELNLKKRLEQSDQEKRSLEADLLEIEELNNKIEKLRRELHAAMKALDMERDKNSQYTSLIDQREFDYKKELTELLEENGRLRALIKQQQAKLISQEADMASGETKRTQISLRSGCDVNKSHVLQINVNDTNPTDPKRALNAVRLHCN